MDERAILFWVVIGFFTIIGVLSLLAITGVLKPDPAFRRWAISGFVMGIGGAVFGLFNVIFIDEVPLYIILAPPQEVGVNVLDLVSGEYNYDEQTSDGSVGNVKGTVELALGPGGWQVKMPQKTLNKAIELIFQDRNGRSWSVHRFYPNYNRQTLIKRLSAVESSATPAVKSTPTSHVMGATANLAFAQQQSSLKFDNYAQQTKVLSGRPSYRWRIFLNEPPPALAPIAEVQYQLHPTFPEPLQVRRDPSTKFAVDASGWGEFTTLITIRYKNGRVEKTSYRLDLSKGWPKEP